MAPTSTTTSPAWTSKPGAAWYTRSRSTSACRNGRSDRLTAHTARPSGSRARASPRRLAVNRHSPFPAGPPAPAGPRGAGRGGGPMLGKHCVGGKAGGRVLPGPLPPQLAA